MKKAYILVTTLILLAACYFLWPRGSERGEARADSLAVATDSAARADHAADSIAMLNSPHLKFKNVPIDGTLSQFVARMVRSGFTVEHEADGQATLSGDFAGTKECTVLVETLSGKDLVAKITVEFPRRDQWKHLLADYRELKELLTTKYGKPSSCVEKFRGPYGLKPVDESDKLNYLHHGNCKYETTFATSKGNITLWMGTKPLYNDHVYLSYKDKINGKEIRNHAIDDL